MGNEASKRKHAAGAAASSARADEAATAAAAAAAANAVTTANVDGSVDENAVAIREALTRNHVGVTEAETAPVCIDDFELLKVLGKGSFGKVLLARKKNGSDAGAVFALKVLKKEVLVRRNQVEHTRSERAILSAAGHPFIVTLRYAFQTREKLYLVTDFAPGGELFFWLKRDRVFSQARARLYAAELVLAIEHLHSLDIVYRDLKPENILLDGDGHIRLADFGLSKMDVRGAGPEGGTRTFCGTPEYLAPEILENKGHGKAVDWWSLGTLLYEMMGGLPPFYDTNVELMYEKIMTAELRFPRHFLPETRGLLTGMLTRRVEERLGYGGAAEIKAHAFFAGISWEDVFARRYRPEFVPPANPLSAGGAGDDDDAPERLAAAVINFEEEFTREPAVDSVVAGAAVLSATAAERSHFEGFTYVGDSTIARAAAGGGDGR